MSTPVKKLVMWDVLVLNGMTECNIFVIKEPDYNIMPVSTYKHLNSVFSFPFLLLTYFYKP